MQRSFNLQIAPSHSAVLYTLQFVYDNIEYIAQWPKEQICSEYLNSPDG